MAMIKFVRNHDDLSTDKGYQFKFYCDKCGNGYLSRFQSSVLGMGGSFLRAASDLLGWGHSAGHSAYEIQRAVGGPAHDSALNTAVEEGKQYFHQCTRCGRWVCPEVCWNEKANLCEECAPNYEEEMAAAHAQGKADAMRSQIYQKAQQQDYASNVDMSADAYVQAPPVKQVEHPAATTTCSSCGHAFGSAKFCPECGTPTAPQKATCPGCGFQPEASVKFCPECGTKIPFIS